MITKEELLINIGAALTAFDKKACVSLAEQSIELGIDPVEVIAVLRDRIEVIGNQFKNNEIFLPELVGAGSSMEGAMEILNAEILRRGSRQETLGVVVIGTVFGDLHTIGKGMVSTLLMAEGFEVNDIGINVPAEKFLEAIDQYQASILAMSSLLTTTAPEQQKVIRAIEEQGWRDRVKIMVGGGAVTQEFAERIGADGYAPSAPLAVDLAKELMGFKG